MRRSTGARHERGASLATALRRRRLGRPAQLHRGAPGHPDHRAGPAARADRPRPAPALRMAGREAGGAPVGRIGRPAAAADAQRRVCCYLGQRGRREEAYTRLRSIMREVEFEPPPALRQLAQITDFDLFVTTTFDPLLEQAHQPRALRRPAERRSHRLRAEPGRRPARRAQPAAAHGRLPPARPAVGLADLRGLRRGHARVHLRAAVRAPDAREALPRARAQPPAADRQRFLQLAGAAVPAHGQAPAPVRSARRRRGVRRRPHHAGRAAGGVPAAGQRAHARLRRRRGVRRRAARALDEAARRPQPARRGSARRPLRFLPPSREMPENAIFISYAREDLPAVQRLKAATRCRRAHDLVRPRPARRRRRLRPQDPRQHRALQLLRARSSRRRRSGATRAISGASGATRSIARATSPRARCSSCRCASTTRPKPRRWCRSSSGRCTSRALPGGEPAPEFLRRLQDLFSGRRS